MRRLFELMEVTPEHVLVVVTHTRVLCVDYSPYVARMRGGGGGHGAVYSPRGRHSQTWFDDMGIDAETQP